MATKTNRAQGKKLAFQVQKNQCNQCLFSENRIVSADRAREIIANCVKTQNYFVCHKDQTTNHKRPMKKFGVCCKGYYDTLGKHSQAIRMAEALGILEFIEVKDEDKKC